MIPRAVATCKFLNNPPVHHGNPLPLCARRFKSGNLASRQIKLALGRRKGRVGRAYLRRVDKRFSVKPKVAPLFALGDQTGFVAKGVINPIYGNDPCRPRPRG